jgi:hypothetical protein
VLNKNLACFEENSKNDQNTLWKKLKIEAFSKNLFLTLKVVHHNAISNRLKLIKSTATKGKTNSL